MQSSYLQEPSESLLQELFWVQGLQYSSIKDHETLIISPPWIIQQFSHNVKALTH